MENLSHESILRAMEIHLQNRIYGVNAMLRTANVLETRSAHPEPQMESIPLHTLQPLPDMIPDKTPIETFNHIFN